MRKILSIAAFFVCAGWSFAEVLQIDLPTVSTPWNTFQEAEVQIDNPTLSQFTSIQSVKIKWLVTDFSEAAGVIGYWVENPEEPWNPIWVEEEVSCGAQMEGFFYYDLGEPTWDILDRFEDTDIHIGWNEMPLDVETFDFCDYLMNPPFMLLVNTGPDDTPVNSLLVLPEATLGEAYLEITGTVPEPATLLLTALGGLVLRIRRK